MAPVLPAFGAMRHAGGAPALRALRASGAWALKLGARVALAFGREVRSAERAAEGWAELRALGDHQKK